MLFYNRIEVSNNFVKLTCLAMQWKTPTNTCRHYCMVSPYRTIVDDFRKCNIISIHVTSCAINVYENDQRNIPTGCKHRVGVHGSCWNTSPTQSLPSSQCLARYRVPVSHVTLQADQSDQRPQWLTTNVVKCIIMILVVRFIVYNVSNHDLKISKGMEIWLQLLYF